MKHDTGVGREASTGTALKKHVLLYAGFLVLALALLLVLNSGGARAENIPAGSISTDTNWNSTGSPYHIQGDVTVDPGVTLTIDNDVDVVFDGYFMLDVQGGLVVNGDATWVEFYGNGVQWNGVFFSAADQACSLKNVSFSNADHPIEVTDSQVSLNGIDIDSTCLYSARYYEVSGGDLTAQISRFTSDTSSPLYFSADSGDISVVLNEAYLNSYIDFETPGNVAFDIVGLELYGLYGVYVENEGWINGFIDDAYIESFASSVYLASDGDAKLAMNGSALYSYGDPIYVDASAVTLDVQNTTLASDYNAVEVYASSAIYANFYNVMVDSSSNGIMLSSGEDIDAKFSYVTVGENYYGSGEGIYTHADGETKVSMVGCDIYEYSANLVEVGGAENVSFLAEDCYFYSEYGYQNGLYVHSDKSTHAEIVDSQFYGMNYQAHLVGAEGVDAYVFNDTFIGAYYSCLYVETDTGNADVWVEDSFFDSSYGADLGAIVVLVNEADANVDVINTEVHRSYYGLVVNVDDGDASVNIDPSYFDDVWIGVSISSSNIELTVNDTIVDGEDWGYYSSGTGIEATAAYDLTAILDNATVANYSNGVVLWAQEGTADVTMTGCQFTSVYGSDDWMPESLSAPYAGALSILAGGSLEVTIGTCDKGNTFEDVGTAVAVACLPGANSVSNVSVVNNTINDADYGILVEFLSRYADTLGTNQLEVNVAIEANKITEAGFGILVPLEFQTYYDNYLGHVDATTQEVKLDLKIVNNQVQSDSVGIAVGVLNQAVAYTDEVMVTGKTCGKVVIEANQLNCSGMAGVYFMNYQAADSNLFGYGPIGGYSASVISDLKLSILDNKVWTPEYQALEYGIYVMENAQACYDWSEANVTTDVQFDGNEVAMNGGSASRGISFELSAESYFESALVKIDTNAKFTDNIVGPSLNGALFYGLYFKEEVSASYDEAAAEHTSQVSMNGNQVAVDTNGSSGAAIYAYEGSEAYYGSASVDSNLNTIISNNKVSTPEDGWTEYGIYYQEYDYNAYGSSAVEVDSQVLIQENHLSIDGAMGIDVELTASSYYGDGLCDSNAVAKVSGNELIVSGNIGILVSNYVNAQNLEASVDAVRDVLICNNHVVAPAEGSLSNGIEYYQEDYAHYDSATMTDDAAVKIQNNQVELEDCYAGINVYVTPNGYSAAGGEAECHSLLSATVSGNTLNVGGGYGIYIYGQVYADTWYYYDNPEATLDYSVIVNQNKICVPEDQYLQVGIGLFPYASAYDSYYQGTEALCNFDATVSANTVNGAAYGIQFNPLAYSYYGAGYAAVDADVSICNNVLSNGEYAGIYVNPVGEGYGYSDELMANVSVDASICGNTISGFYYGVEASWSADYWYSYSVLVNLSVQVCNNNISECVYGIYLYEIDGLVSGNLVKDCYEGIYLYDCFDMVVSENTLSHNGVDQEGYALYVGDCSNITFEGNTISHNEYGVYVYDSSEIYFNDNEVSYSRFNGAYFGDNEILSIEGSTFANNFGDGVYLDSNEETIFGNNTVASNGDDGFIAYTDGEMRMFNGVFADNLNSGVHVENGANDWFVDATCIVRNNPVYFEGSIVVQDGGSMTLDTVNEFRLNSDYHGYGSIVVEEGGSLLVVNCVIDGWWYAFDIQGNLDMDNTKVMNGKELYLGPTCSADIRGSTVVNMVGNGIHIDSCSPRITGTVVALNGKDGIFIEGDENASPIIQGCTIAANARGIFCEGASLDRVIGNLITMNSVAGIYVLEGSGKVADNTLMLNKVEIYLLSSDVQVCGNHIGYSSQMDRVYTLMLALGEYGDVGDWYWAATPEMVADLLVNHIGIYAEDSAVKTSGNSYGMLTTAVYAVDSTINFGDDIVPCGCESATVWYLSEELEYDEMPVTFYDGYTLVNASIPTEVVNGIFLQNSSMIADGITMEVTDNGIFMDDAVATLSNCTLSAGGKDLYLVNGSDARLTDVAYDSAEVQGDSSLNVQSAQKPSGTIFGMDPVALVAVVLIIVIAILLGVFLLRRKK